jgi:Flp pilus assembly protein TadD
MKLRALLWIVLASSLGACTLPMAKDRVSRTESSLHNELIRGMLGNGQYYAALAHIDDERRRSGESPELSALRADALAALGRTREADAIYRSLLQGEFAGDGYHGLGLLHVRTNPATGIAYLKSAVARRPTSAQWRNDLGYALMSNGRLSEALPEIATATELDPASERYRNNLMILLILMKDEPRITRLQSQWNLPSKTLGELRRQAQALQVQAKPATPVKPARKG